MRILLTGASGFIGGRLLPVLAREHTVTALVRRPPAQPLPGVRYCLQDLTAPLDHTALPAAVDAVIHQAALIDADHATADADPFLVNVVATQRLLEYAARAGATLFVHASTGGVYGCSPHPLTEDSPLHPMDRYSLTKAQAELAVEASRYTVPDRAYATVILRYFFPYGVGTPNPIPRYVEAAVRGDPIALPEGGGPRFNPLHIDDAVAATLAALTLTTDTVLNIAGTEITTFGEIARLAAARAGHDLRLTTLPAHAVIPYYRSHLVADITRMQTQLGFTPRIPLADGLAELLSNYCP